MKKLAALVLALAVIATATHTVLQADDTPSVVTSLSEAQWGPAPPMIPAGAKIAVLSGNPMGTGAYAVRLRFPANYAIAAHSHPTDENVTVVSGTLYMGMGDKLDRKAGKGVTVGGFAQAPAKVNHFAFTKGGPVTIVLHGIGPVEFNYVNAADDPRNAKK